MAYERAAGPGAFTQLLHDRSIRFAAGLAVAVAIPVAVLFYFQFRSLGDLERTSTVVLRQLSRDSADALTRSIEDALKAPHIRVLLRVAQPRVEPLDLHWIEPVFVDNLQFSPFIDAFYVYSLATDRHRDRLLAIDRQPRAGMPTVDGTRFQPDDELARVLVPRLREYSRQKRAIVTLQLPIRGRSTYVQAQVRWLDIERERFSSFVAFAVDAERLRTEYFPTFLRQRLATISGPSGFPPLQVMLGDEAGRTVLDTSGLPSPVYIDRREFPLVFFDKQLLEYAAPLETHREIWRLGTGYGDQTLEAIVSAETRPQIALMAVLAVVMACGVFFVAGAAAREVRLAELKSNFVSSVSHDLKTPLALIQLFAETLELGRLKSTERASEYYRIINSEARKLTRLIENILDFSKMEAGLRPYRIRPVDLGNVTRRALAALESQLKQNQFTVRAEIPDEGPAVMADADAVEQALENLLSNAMKYSGESRDIRVRAGVEDRRAFVAVTDFGIGIPRRHQRKIFRKFYRIESDAVSGPQGCGLGLAIVDHTMRGHGGQVRVDSEPGRGSTFTLSLPLATGAITHEAYPGDRGRAADAARTA